MRTSRRILPAGMATALALLCAPAIPAQTTDQLSPPPRPPELGQLVGQPVDLAPWAYTWRSDRAVQQKPEACFIPRRLDRIEKIYRTARTVLSPQDLKSLYYKLPDLLDPLPPSPKGPLQAGLLWTGGVSKYQVELVWPTDAQELPSPEKVDVRVYPTSFGWFGWTVDKILTKPVVSQDKHTWVYKCDPDAKMDTSYDGRLDAATEMVAVFYDDPKVAAGLTPVIPTIRVTGPSLGTWRQMDVELEWGFAAGAEQTDYDGRLEPHVAILGSIAPLADDKGTQITSPCVWRSRPAGSTRRGLTVSLLFAPDSRPGLDSRITIWDGKGGFTVRLIDLNNGPVFVPAHGVVLTKAGSGQTARQFVQELAAKNLKGIRQMTREHREATSWDEVMREVRLWTCPPNTPVPPFPQVDAPPMQVHLPDPRMNDVWCTACQQLRGRHMWGGLAFEVARVAHEMNLVGLTEEADKVYAYFLNLPGAKSDGDYSDGQGALEKADSMRHDMGYSHDGTHASTGRLLFAMADRYFLTGDKEWFQRNRARLQAAADWIIRQRTTYMKDLPNRQELFVVGLMPPCMLGDYALPACDWHWYYVDNAFSLQGLQRFADVLAEFDPAAGRKYFDEAEAYRKDLRRVVDREAALSPVRLGRDGAYHSYIPRMAYAAGLTGPELGAPQFPDCDRFMAALPLAEPLVLLNPTDTRVMDSLDMMEEMGTSPTAVQQLEAARKQQGVPTDDAWFWNSHVRLPKASHNANVYLYQDDIPNFLRFWLNTSVVMVGSNGKFWEPWNLGNYNECTAPDNGTAGWFLENFRNMLVMEDGQSLWLARATPRAWLEQGKKIAVNNAPTWFGTTAYEIVSDVDGGKITATVVIPNRAPPRRILLRFRHPQASPIKSVTVNGQPWAKFDPAKETIELAGLSGKVTVVAGY